MIYLAKLEKMSKLSAAAVLVFFSALGCSTDSGAGAAAGASGAAPSGAGASGAGTGGMSASGGSGPSTGGSGSGGLAGGASSAAGQGGNGGSTASGAGTAGLGGNGASGAGGGGSATAGSGGAGAPVNAATMAADMGFGANIGNTLDNTTTWETGWGEPPITQAFINGMASHGIKTVRVPVAWDTYATAGVIDATKMNRVKEVVGWIQAAGMYSIVDIHWDGGWIDNETNANKYQLTADVKTKFASYWKQIGTAFANVGPKLILEGLNEEGHFYIAGDSTKGPDYAALNQLNQLFVTTVRAQGGYNASRALLIAGFNTDIDLTCVDAFSIPTDPAGAGKLFLSLHYYNPATFTILDTVESWGSPATKWGTTAEQAALDSAFSKAAAFSTQKKVTVIIGEFGVTRGTNYVRDSASRTLWMQSVANASRSRGMVPVLWDTGSEIMRSDGSFSTELQSVMTHLK